MATAIFYASSTGNTEDSANAISKQLGGLDVFNISDFEKIKDYDKVIIGSSTWGDGDLQDDFEDVWDDFCEIDFTGKTVALFCLGDQEGYEDTFLDSMGTIYQQVTKAGAKVVGSTSNDGYEYEESKSEIKDGTLAGLALDEDNQDDLTDERITKWCEQIKGDII